jgi:hypothetical protein
MLYDVNKLNGVLKTISKPYVVNWTLKDLQSKDCDKVHMNCFTSL